MSPPPPLQRAASLAALPGLLADHGIALDRALDGTGIAPDALRPDSFIPFPAFLAILDRAARLTGRADFGLLLAQRQDLGSLGPLGRVLRHAATLGEALGDFAAFQIGNSTGATVYLLRQDQDVLLGYGVTLPGVEVTPVLHDLVLGIGARLVAELTAGAVEPDEALTPRAPPGPGHFRLLGRCPVRCNQPQTGLLLRAVHLGHRLPQADPTLHAAALAELAPTLAKAQGNAATLTRRALRLLLPQGRADMAATAALLHQHPRTLRRRLQAEATTFEALRDEVRETMARELLRIGAIPVGDIAQTLAYTTPAAFTHAFRRRTGVSPMSWRKGAGLGDEGG